MIEYQKNAVAETKSNIFDKMRCRVKFKTSENLFWNLIRMPETSNIKKKKSDFLLFIYIDLFIIYLS
jgi:hypothetical protein